MRFFWHPRSWRLGRETAVYIYFGTDRFGAKWFREEIEFRLNIGPFRFVTHKQASHWKREEHFPGYRPGVFYAGVENVHVLN